MRVGAFIRGLTALVLVVVAFAAGRCSAERDERPGAGDDDVAAPVRRDRAPTKPRASRTGERVVSPPGATDLADPGAPDDAGARDEGTVDRAITLDVLVVDDEGEPSENAWAYLLPAGETGTDDTDEIPWAETDDAGRARLSAVRAGLYDVGAVSGVLAAMARDVALPADGPVRLTFPPEELVMVRSDVPFTADAAGKPQPQIAYARRDDDVPQRVLPGRGQATHIAWSLTFTPTQLTQPMFLPAGTRVRLQVPPGTVCDPEAIVVPATVVIQPDPRPELRLRVQFEPADFVPSQAWVLTLEVDAGPGSSPRQFALAWKLQAGTALGSQATEVLTLRVPEGPCAVRWSGRTVRPGEVQVADPKATSAETPVALVVHVETERFVGTGPTPNLTLRFAHDPVLDPREPEVAWCAWRGEEIEGGSVDWADGVTHVVRADADWLLAVTGLSFAGPVRAPTADGAVVDLAFRPGGCLVVVPEGAIPSRFGQLMLRRKDRAPIPRPGDDNNSADFDVARRVAPGLVLGPFPPGDVAFEVFLGRTRIAEIVGRVDAGRFVALTVPVLPRK